MTDNRPIGVFDSGLGGLCTVRHLQTLLPHEDIIYLGDTGRVPYGTKSRETIIGYARQDASFLLSKNVKMIVAACGTVSSVALDEIKSDIPVKTVGIVDGAVKAALGATENGKIGVIGTSATISSGMFEKKLRTLGECDVISRACPLFVPLVECGFVGRGNEVARRVCESYLDDIRRFGADTLILGCTHFPLLSDVISDVLPGVCLIDAAKLAALGAKDLLEGLETDRTSDGKTDYFVTDDAEGFSAAAAVFLGESDGIRAEKVELNK